MTISPNDYKQTIDEMTKEAMMNWRRDKAMTIGALNAMMQIALPIAALEGG